MLRLVVNNSTLSGSVHLNTSGTIDDYIGDSGAYTLTASRQTSESVWDDTTHSQIVTTMLFGGTGSSDDNGTVVFGGTSNSWDFGNGLLDSWIKKNGHPYLSTLNTFKPTVTGNLTLCAGMDLDIGRVAHAKLIETAITAGEEFPYSSLPADELLQDLNYNESGEGYRTHLLITPSVHHCNPNYDLLAINKFIWYLYKAYNSLIARMLDWVFSNKGFDGFGIGLNTYKNFQALVGFLNLYSWQQGYVLRVSSSGDGVGIVFGYVESECSHENLTMDLEVSIVSAQSGSDVAYRQPYALYLTGVDSTVTDTTSVSMKQLYQFGYVLDTNSASWVDVDGSGTSRNPKSKAGYDLFGGAKASITLSKISVGQKYLIGLEIAPVSGEKRDWTEESGYPPDENCILMIRGIWHTSPDCDVAHSADAEIKALRKGVSSSDPGYVDIVTCEPCGLYTPGCTYIDWPDTQGGSWYRRVHCWTSQYPTQLSH